MKDNFSKQSDLYSRFRPGYPNKLFQFLLPLIPNKDAAWDCGTGNGQVAIKLAAFFKEVYATDISTAQIDNATKKENIFYEVVNAEDTKFENNAFDIITVAQAIHWFNFEIFYNEVNRTLKPGGIIAVFGYDIFSINKEIDNLIQKFYKETTGPYWDKERRYIDEQYKTIPFPFKQIEAPEFSMSYTWQLEQVIGYLNTWSAVQHYIRKNDKNPVDAFAVELHELWGNIFQRKVTFKIFMRLGRK